jgi:hypothetical protein
MPRDDLCMRFEGEPLTALLTIRHRNNVQVVKP